MNRTRSTTSNIAAALAVTAWTVFSFIAAAFLGGLLFAILGKVTPIEHLGEAAQSTMRAAVMFAFAAAIAIGIPRGLRRQRITKSLLGVSRLPSWSDMLFGPLAYIPYIIITISLAALATALLPGFDLKEVQDVGFNAITNRYELILAFLTLVIVAPIAEELLFRGYLYGSLKRRVGVVAAILVTSFVFGLLHLQLNVAVDVFALSIVLCILRETTGSIWAGVLLHMTKNSIAFYVLFASQLL